MGASVVPEQAPNIEFVLSQQANDAIAKGANPEAVSQRLGQMVTHLRSNPTLAAQASDALARGADIGAIAPRILQLASSGTGNIDLRDGAQQTRAPQTPAPAPQGSPNAAEGVLDSGLDTFTFGLHRKGLGVTQAIGDVLEHGLNSHPIDTYENSVNNTLAREHAASSQHPTSTSAANATGFFGALAAEAPVRALLGLGEAAPAAATALKRIGQSTKTGAVTGAAIGATSGEGTPRQRVGESVLGGLLGGVFGGGSQAAGEFGGKIADLIHQISADPAAQGALSADKHIVQRLAADDLDPRDLLRNAQVSAHTGAPTVAAHLGGPSLDPLTWLAAQGPSQEAGTLRAAINRGQRAEGDLLNRGITDMSGIPNAPSRDAKVFSNQLNETRSANAATDYEKAYAAPPLQDPQILSIIRKDPDLRASLNEGLQIMKRERQVAAIRGDLLPPVKNPLAKVSTEPTLTPQGKALAEMGVPMDKLLAEGHATPAEPADAPEIPIQLLDYMKRGADVVVERGLKKGNLSSRDAGLLSQKVDAILAAVDQKVPEYAAARARYANASGQIEATEAGKKAFKSSGPAITDELSQLAPDAARAHRTGFTSELRGDIAGRGNDSNISRTFDNPFTQNQLTAEFGDKGVGKFSPYMDQAQTLNRVREAAAGNSQTAPRQAIRQEVLDGGTADALDLPTTPKHAVLRFLNAKDAARRQAVLQALAARLNIPADSPELPRMVEALYKSVEVPTTDATRRGELFRGVTTAIRGPRAQGILAGLFAGGQ